MAKGNAWQGTRLRVGAHLVGWLTPSESWPDDMRFDDRSHGLNRPHWRILNADLPLLPLVERREYVLDFPASPVDDRLICLNNSANNRWRR